MYDPPWNDRHRRSAESERPLQSDVRGTIRQPVGRGHNLRSLMNRRSRMGWYLATVRLGAGFVIAPFVAVLGKPHPDTTRDRTESPVPSPPQMLAASLRLWPDQRKSLLTCATPRTPSWSTGSLVDRLHLRSNAEVLQYCFRMTSDTGTYATCHCSPTLIT